MIEADRDVFPHVRGRDREQIGWLRMTSEGQFEASDLLWRPVCEPTDLESAEAALDDLGLRYLADDWWLDGDLRVQIVQIEPRTVTIAPVAESENLAKTLDLTRTSSLPIPTDRLRERPDAAGSLGQFGEE